MRSPPNHPREAERLALLQRCEVLDTPPEQEFDRLVALASAIAGTPIALVSLIDQDRQWFKARHGLAAAQTPREVAFCSHAILGSDQTLVVEDARSDPRFADNPLVRGQPHVIFYVGVPLLAGPDHLPLGTLCVIDHTPRVLSGQVLEHLRTIARQVEILLDLRLRHSELAHARLELERTAERDALQAKAAAQVEERLRDSLHRFDLVVAGAAIGIWETRFDPERWSTQITNELPFYWSRRFIEIMGYTPDEFPDRLEPWLTALHPDDREHTLAAVGDCLANGVPYNVEYRLRHRNGDYRWYHATGEAERDELGRPTRMAGSMADISARKQSDAEIHTLKDQLQDAIESLGAGFVMYDADERLVISNRKYRELYHIAEEFLQPGVRYEDMMRRSMSADPENFRSLVGDDGIEAFIKKRLLAFRTMQSNQQQKVGDRWIQVNERRTSSGGCISLRTDITDLKNLEVVLQQALQAQKQSAAEAIAARQLAESASRAKADFLATMSHEIRTPMNGVIGMTSLLINTPLSGEQHEYIDAIRLSGDALLAIINDILDFSKIEAGKMTVEEVPFDLRTATEDVIDLLGAKASGKDIDLLLDYPDATVSRFIGDDGRVRQILLNLVGNAVKFTAHGAVTVTVTRVGFERSQARMRLVVQDSGIGMDQAQVHRLFQPFSQADASTSRRFGGTGLGLAITARLCGLLGGTISADSEPSIGSRFIVELPFTIDASALAMTSKEPAILRKQAVLVVGDREPSGAILRDALAGWGMRVGVANHAHEAAEILARSTEPTVVVIDQRAATDAAGILATIRNRATRAVIMAVMIARDGARGDAERLAALGFDAYLSRPLRLDLLRQALVATLEGRGNHERLVTRHSIIETTVAQVRQAEPIAMPCHGRRVLVVEDNSINQKVVRRMLERMHCLVDLATNGAEAVEYAARVGYDLILMDCQMPVMDGLDATRAIRAGAGPCRGVPIVALTANAMPRDREACLAVGMNDHLAKPITAEILATTVHKWAGVVRMPTLATAAASATATALTPGVFEELQTQMGDRASVVEMIDLFLADLPQALARMQAHLASGQEAGIDSIRRIAHSFKGSCKVLGVHRLSQLCDEIERLPKAGAQATCSEVLSRFTVEAQHVTKQLIVARVTPAAIAPSVE